MSQCSDENHDHKCDCCEKVLSICEDDDHDHLRDECNKKLSDCADTNPKDHTCDICGTKLSDHDDDNKDHNCDYCGAEVTPTKQNPRIVSNLSTPAFSYKDGFDLELVDGNETLYYLLLKDIEVGFEFYISNYESSFKNFITTNTGAKDGYNTTCFSIKSSGVAHFNVGGSFKIYFETGDTNPGISVTATNVSTDYRFYETVRSSTTYNYLGFAYETGEHSRVTYEFTNQVFATGEYIQIKKGTSLKYFTFDTNLNSSLYTYITDKASNSVYIKTKISDECRVKLYVSLEDMSLTLSIRYEKQ